MEKKQLQILTGCWNSVYHPKFNIQLNDKYTLKQDNITNIDYEQLAKNITKYINVGEFHVVQGILNIINYSLFLHENRVDSAFIAISKLDFTRNPKIKKLLFTEMVRLNIWALISEGKSALRGKYKLNGFLEEVVEDLPFTIYKVHQHFLPKDLRIEAKNALDNHFNQRMAVQDVVNYIIKAHVKIRNRIVASVLEPRASSAVKTLATLINRGIVDNDPDAVQSGLRLSKSAILRMTKNNYQLNPDTFEDIHKQLITNSLANQSYQGIALSILQMIGAFDLFLMTTKVSCNVMNQNKITMQNCLHDLLKKGNLLKQIGIDISLSESVQMLNTEQLTTALYSFIYFIYDNKGYIIRKMVNNNIL